MNIPTWWEATLLVLAIYRCFRLLAKDDIANEARNWVLNHVPPKIELLIQCPWCAGTYIGLAWWGMWQWQPHGTLVVAAAAAILCAVGMISKLDPD